MKVLTPGIRLILTMACAVVVIGGLHAAGKFIVPVVLAYFLAILNLPITNGLTSRRVPHFLAVLLTVFFNLAVISAVMLIGLSLVSSFRGRAPTLVVDLYRTTEVQLDSVTQKVETFLNRIQSARSKDDEVPEQKKPEGKEDPLPDPQTNPDPLAPDELQVDPGDNTPVSSDEAGANTPEGPVTIRGPTDKIRKEITDFLRAETRQLIDFIVQANFFGGVIKFLGTSFLVFVIMIFILSEAKDAPNRLQKIIAARGPDLHGLGRLSEDVQRYLGIKTAISISTGLLAWLLTWAFGLEFPLLWGILAFVLNYIPVIGSVIAGIPPALLALASLGVWEALLIMAGYFCINILLGSVLEPMLLGRRFGLSTVMVILSVVFWGWLWGIVGTFLAVPLTMMMKVLLEMSDDFRWIAVAMSKDAPKLSVPRRRAKEETSPDDSG